MKLKKSVCAGAVLVLGLSFGAPSAYAVGTPDSEVYEALEAVQANGANNVTDPLAGIVALDAISAEGKSTVVDASGTQVELPATTADPLSITGKDGTTASVVLPNSGSGAAATVISGDAISYDNKDGSHTVPLVKQDGSVQVTTVIDGPSSPTSYEYEFNLPDGATLQTEGEGVVFIAADGSMIGGVAPAWAVDSEGAAVNTHYEINGTVLTQVVDHGEGTQYPVVADPLWGTDLIQSVRWINRSGLVSLSIVPTGWNRFNTNFGPAITAGWDEALSKTVSSYVNGRWYSRATANTTQMYWQYNCHQVLAFSKGEWNLEPSTYRSSYAAYSANLCN